MDDDAEYRLDLGSAKFAQTPLEDTIWHLGPGTPKLVGSAKSLQTRKEDTSKSSLNSCDQLKSPRAMLRQRTGPNSVLTGEEGTGHLPSGCGSTGNSGPVEVLK